MSGFARLHKKAVEDGALSGKTKELMALAISIASQPPACSLTCKRTAFLSRRLSGKIIVVGEPDATIDAALPLLNAILPNIISYYPLAGVMMLRRRPGLITLYPRRVTIAQVADVEEGLSMLAAVRDLVNQAWSRRNEIQPKTESRRAPRPLDACDQGLTNDVLYRIKTILSLKCDMMIWGSMCGRVK